jgi:hypothetical protein
MRKMTASSRNLPETCSSGQLATTLPKCYVEKDFHQARLVVSQSDLGAPKEFFQAHSELESFDGSFKNRAVN